MGDWFELLWKIANNFCCQVSGWNVKVGTTGSGTKDCDLKSQTSPLGHHEASNKKVLIR